MTTKTITFSNQKGGVGKSFLSTQFALFLAEKQNKKVLFIDLDSQSNATKRLLKYKKHLVNTKESYKTLYNGSLAYELFEDQGQVNACNIIPNLSLIGGSTSIKDKKLGYAVEVLKLDRIMIAIEKIRKLGQDFDFVVVDPPPAVGRLTYTSLGVSDYIVAPIVIEDDSIDAFVEVNFHLNEVRSTINPNVVFLGCVVNMLQDNAEQRNKLKELRSALAKSDMENLLLGNPIHHRSPYSATVNTGLPVWRLPSSKRGNMAEQELTNVFNDILNRL